MKNIVFSLFIFLLLCTAGGVLAANTTLLIKYPSPSGNLNQVVFQAPPSEPDCSQSINNGLLFMDKNYTQLEVCINGIAKAIPAPEVCFNRYCDDSQGDCSSSNSNNFANAPQSCPSGYKQAKIGSPTSSAIIDHFPSSSINHNVYTTVCCKHSGDSHYQYAVDLNP